MLYDESRGWPILATCVARRGRGRRGRRCSQLSDNYLGRGPDGTYTSAVEANAVINCVDRPEPKAPEPRRELADVVRFQAELPPWGGGWALAGCAGMPKPAKGDKLGDVTVTGAPPILVVGTTGDPATPYAGAGAMVGAHRRLRAAHVRQHRAHRVRHRPQHLHRRRGRRYLVDGVMPAARHALFSRVASSQSAQSARR